MPGSQIVYAPVGDSVQNGFDAGGSRIYPWSTGLAIKPLAIYGDYIGSATGLPVAPPVSSLVATAGANPGSAPGISQMMANPFSLSSPIPWVVVGLLGAIIYTHKVHYSR